MEDNIDDLKRAEANSLINDVLNEHFEEKPNEQSLTNEQGIVKANNYLKIYDQIKREISGNITSLLDNEAKSTLLCTKHMAVDKVGLIHNGFVFNAASFCASASINEPNIFIVGSKVKFLAPSKVDDVINFEAESRLSDGRKKEVIVKAFTNEIKVFEAEFYAILLNEHPLENKWYLDKNIKK